MSSGRRPYFPSPIRTSHSFRSVVERLPLHSSTPITIMFTLLNVFFALFAGSVFAAPIKIRSETHTINMVNNCGTGTVCTERLYFGIHELILPVLAHAGTKWRRSEQWKFLYCFGTVHRWHCVSCACSLPLELR